MVGGLSAAWLWRNNRNELSSQSHVCVPSRDANDNEGIEM
jgi:hypothetical protein